MEADGLIPGICATALKAKGRATAQTRQRWERWDAWLLRCSSVGRMATLVSWQGAKALGAWQRRGAGRARQRWQRWEAVRRRTPRRDQTALAALAALGGRKAQGNAEGLQMGALDSVCAVRWGADPKPLGSAFYGAETGCLEGCVPHCGESRFFALKIRFFEAMPPATSALKSCYCGRSGGAYLGLYIFWGQGGTLLCCCCFFLFCSRFLKIIGAGRYSSQLIFYLFF